MTKTLLFRSADSGTDPETGPEGAVQVNHPTWAGLLSDLEARLVAHRGFAVATLNLDHLVKLRRQPDFRAAYGRHSHVVADGNPIVWLHRLAGREMELVAGSDLIRPLADLAARREVPVAFFGSSQQTLDRAAETLAADYPGLQVVARISPPLGFDPRSAAALPHLDAIAASGARLVFVALGAPKQEFFAVRGLERMPDRGFVSIGAGLDFIAGKETRAPLWVRRIAMEWAWRMARNPRRMVGRYASCVAILPGLAVTALRSRRAVK